MNTMRCAIYTRKSSEEGLEQDFNSLDAQREACAAYILSQASEGWSALPERYDDGGVSGGTLERPALKRLLADVAAGRIDIIVVYKVDRLSRSLFDFAKLVETFEKASTSFMSVTQSFNTTTSMGRLTLNMLLSFAQFEREVTAERIRDKITASKAKGMWMGGTPPLGYQPDGRTLAIVEEHAGLVRHIHERYLALGSVRALQDELNNQRIVAPHRTLTNGRVIGGAPFSRGQLYFILRNPVYAGKIAHRGTVHDGQHAGIVPTETWERVQALLAEHRQGSTLPRTRARSPSLLASKVFDAAGNALIASHACKVTAGGSVRYRYYVSDPAKPCNGKTTRLPARELEAAVVALLSEQLADPLVLAERAWLDTSPAALAQLFVSAAAVRPGDPATLVKLVERVVVTPDGITITCPALALAEVLGARLIDDAPSTIEFSSAVRMKRSGHVTRLIHDNGSAIVKLPNPALVRLLIQAQRWWAQLRSGEVNVTQLAAREGVVRSYVTRVVRLAFLSPAVIDAILAGTQRPEVGCDTLTSPEAIPASWKVQAAAMLLSNIEPATNSAPNRSRYTTGDVRYGSLPMPSSA